MSTEKSVIERVTMPDQIGQHCSHGISAGERIKSNWRSWSSKGVLTLIDQGLIGGSNFLIAILLARQLSHANYGAYAVAFEIFLVVSMVYSCLVLEPMLVFGPSRYSGNFRQYFGALVWMHLGTAFATVLVLGGAAWLIYAFGKSSDLASALTAATIATPCVLLFWLARRAFYVRLEPGTAVLGGLLYGSILLGGALLLYLTRLLSPVATFLIMGAGGLASSVLLLWRLKPSLSLSNARVRFGEIGKCHWVYGRWAISAAVASWMAGNVYYILLSTMRGLADTGSLKALLNFASPLGQALAAVSMLVLPFAARKAEEDGATGVERFSWRVTPLYAAAGAVYWLTFLIFMHPIIRFLYRGNYAHVQYLVPWVAIGSVLRTTTVVQMIGLKAQQLPFLGFVAFALSDAAATIIGIPAVQFFGLEGAIGAYIVSGVVGFVAGWLLVRNVARRSRKPMQLALTPEANSSAAV